MKIYIAPCLLFFANGLFGFELNKEAYQAKQSNYRVRTPIHAASSNISSSLINNDILGNNLCLVFEDHFNTLNFKNWQVCYNNEKYVWFGLICFLYFFFCLLSMRLL